MTDSIAPLVRGVALPARPVTSTPSPSTTPSIEITNRDKESVSSTCTTAEGTSGKCQDLSNCPQLLLDLTKLRQSLCFKSLFVPGVCCPVDKAGSPLQHVRWRNSIDSRAVSPAPGASTETTDSSTDTVVPRSLNDDAACGEWKSGRRSAIE